MSRKNSNPDRCVTATPCVRWMALLSLLLLWLVPQAHLLLDHSDAVSVTTVHRGKAATSVQAEAKPLTDAADVCMLCSVFGSVMQVSLLRMTAPAVPALHVAYAATPHVAARPPTFDLLSRPPPATPAAFIAGVGSL